MPGPEFDFLDLDLLVLELRFVLPLALTVFELAEIHDAADGRLRRRRNFHQIQLGLFGKLVSRRDTDNTDLFTTGTNNPDFRCVNLRVDPGFFFLCYAITP